MRFTGINRDTVRKGIGIAIGYGKCAAGNGRYNPNRIQCSGIDDDVVVKGWRVDKVISSRSAAQVLYRDGISYIVRTIRLADTYDRPCLIVGNERQVSADLVFLIRVAVVIRIQRSTVVQALSRYGSVSRGRARRGRSRTAGRVDIVAAVRRSGRQAQSDVVRQLVGLGSARRDADVIGQRVRVAIDKGQSTASYRRHDISRRVIGRNDRNIVVEVWRIHEVVRTCCTAQVHHLYRIHGRVRAVRVRARHHHHVFMMRDVGQVAAYLVLFFRVAVAVRVQRRHIVQAFARFRVSRTNGFATGRIGFVAAIRAAVAQVQRYVDHQRIGVQTTCANDLVVGQRPGAAARKAIGKGSAGRLYDPFIIGAVNGDVVVKVRRIDEGIVAGCIASIGHGHRVSNIVGAICLLNTDHRPYLIM